MYSGMKIRIVDKVGIMTLICGAVAIYLGAYFTQLQTENIFAAGEYDYTITTMISNPVTTGATTIMHFFSNQTDDTDHATTITSVLPNSLNVVGTIPAITSTQTSGDDIIYAFAATGSEGTILIDIEGQPGVYGLMRNTVSILVDVGDLIQDNNTYESSFILAEDVDGQADIYVESEDVSTPEGTSVWDTVIFSFRATNAGTDTWYWILAQYTLDEWLLISGATPTPSLQVANVLQREIDDLPVGQYVDFQITAEIMPSITSGETLTNTIDLSSPIDDPDTGNNQASTSMIVFSNSSFIDLTIASDASICLNQSGHVLIGYRNNNTRDHYINIEINRPSSISMTGFVPIYTTETSGLYGRDIGSISGTAEGSIDFDVTPTTIGDKTITVQAFDEVSAVRDTGVITFTVTGCGGTGVDNGTWVDEGTGVDEWTGITTGIVTYIPAGSSWTSYLTLVPTTGHLAAPQAIDASMYECADEIVSWYVYVYDNGLTSMPTLQRFRPCDKITRIELAKLLVNYAVRILGKVPDEKRICIFKDMNSATNENQVFAELICKLGIMGLKSDGTPDTVFNPRNLVTRAQFWTAISRQLYGSKYNTSNYKLRYLNHLEALKKDNLMLHIDVPTMKEARTFISIVLMKADLFYKAIQDNK